MELPPALRQAIDRALSGVGAKELASTAAALSRRYRGERSDGKPHVVTEDDALAYLAARLPATYAAVRAACAAIAEARPDFSPASLFDIGAGPGTALWAATDCSPDIVKAMMIEASPVFARVGQQLAAGAALPEAVWQIGDAARNDIDTPPRDLVTAAYVLNEIAPENRPALIETLWTLTSGTLVIVEPGTPAGWQHVLEARRQLIAAGAYLVAPCPHAQPCPLTPPDWCHFAQRVARSRTHRQAKGAELPWEDEKFSYVALSRSPAAATAARVIAHPQRASGRVTLKLCRPDGTAGEVLISRRDGDLFKRARRCDWGDVL
jgi:ribosomal protein RSM22 (predicted rRNA methylase)